MNTYGNNLKISIFGQSHSPAIGVTIDGLPAGFEVDFNKLMKFISRRAPGQNRVSTARKETDTPEIISGLVDGKTCGAPLCAIIQNADNRSKDYAKIAEMPRPSHADYPAYVKFGGYNDIRGGGQFSGRLTAPLCVAGGIVLQILESMGIKIAAHIYEIAGISDDRFDPVNVNEDDFKRIGEFPTLNSISAEKMTDAVLQAKSQSDSVGGIIECAVIGIKAGYGSPMFEGVENIISQAIFAIPAVKGIEFGAGFESAKLLGSQNNDCYYTENKNVFTETNNCGGISGGITNGMPIIFRAAFKPTPSIAREQNTINIKTMENSKLTIEGRHDPCIVPRAVPAVEAATAIAILDMILQDK